MLCVKPICILIKQKQHKKMDDIINQGFPEKIKKTSRKNFFVKNLEKDSMKSKYLEIDDAIVPNKHKDLRE